MTRQYNDPADGTQSDIGDTQMNDFFYQKKALIEARKEQYFSQMADTISMPKHMGKKIKRYHYLPLLDDANINDQGIDAAGLSAVKTVSIAVTTSDGAIPDLPGSVNVVGRVAYFVGEGSSAALAADAALLAANTWMRASLVSGGLNLTLVGATEDLAFADGVNTTAGLAYALGFRFTQFSTITSGTDDTGVIALADALAVAESGNLYGSSKDVGVISAKLPALTENGGRVNRVGFKRIELEGTIDKFGFFDEYTQESMDFDSDAELMMHINRETIIAANEITEDALQIDLLNGAGVVRYGGVATATSEVTGVTATGISSPTYEDFMRLSIDLDNNRCPKNTKIITGTRMIDTKTIDAARYMYIGSEMIPTIKKMVDLFSVQAFIPVQQYASAGQTATGEIGSVDQFRIIVVPEMMHWAGAGAAEGTNAGYRATGGNYDVFPLLVVGSGSFTTIGFQTDGKTVKFKIKHAKPGSTESYANDPYGETGFYSIKWYYGTMILRPERIAIVKCVAEF